MALRKEAASQNENKYVDYGDCAKNLFLTSPTRPDTILVLQGLLRQYISNATTPISYAPMFGRSFSHTTEANALIQQIEEGTSLADILKTVGEKFSQSFQDSPSCDSSKMLSAFFALYPEHIACLTTQGARDHAKKVALANTGKTSFDEWLRDFPEKHISGKCGDNYQTLAQIAEMLPKTSAPAYARFLLNQIVTNGKFPDELNEESAKRIEPFTGIYAGWVCVALGKMANNLETSLKQEICDFLLKRLEAKTCHHLQIIGACFALSTLATSAEIKNKTAEHLHNFLASHLKNQEIGTDLTREFTSDLSLVKAYMPLLFQAFQNVGEVAKSKSNEKIFDILLDKNYLYPYRKGVVILFEWMDEKSLNKLLTVLNTHPRFDELMPVLFFHILKHSKQNNELTVLTNHYHTRCGNILAELEKPYASTPWLQYFQLLVSPPKWSTVAGTFQKQLGALFVHAFTTFHGTPREHLIHDMLRGLPLCVNGMKPEDKNAIQHSICSSLLPPKNTKLAMNVHALQTLVKMKSDLSAREFDLIVNLLLKLLKEQLKCLLAYKNKKADMPNIDMIKTMLNEIVAIATGSFPADKLPSLLAFLEACGQTGDVQIDEQLQLTIGTIAKVYPGKINEHFKTMVPLANNTPRPK